MLKKCFIIILCLISLSNLLFAEETATVPVSPLWIAFKIERLNNFLEEPDNHPLEIFRRIGRSINTFSTSKKTVFKALSKFDPTFYNTPDYMTFYTEQELEDANTKLIDELLSKYSNEISSLIGDFSSDEPAFFIKFAGEVVDGPKMQDRLKEQMPQPLTPKTASPINVDLVPTFGEKDLIYGFALLTDKGLKSELLIKAGDEEITPETTECISIGNYLNPSALMYFAQTHFFETPKQTIEKLNEIPQAKSVLDMLTSVGLDFETDILSNSAKESVLYINLAPDLETSLPDIRFVTVVPNIDNLRANFDKLRELCMLAGVFLVEPTDASYVELSYFILPQYKLYIGLVDEILVISTLKTALLKEMDHISQVKTAEQPAHEADSYQRFWRINFTDFNRQLQTLLQSPLLSGQQIPPIPNLTMLDDLEYLSLKAKNELDTTRFIIEIPVKASE